MRNRNKIILGICGQCVLIAVFGGWGMSVRSASRTKVTAELDRALLAGEAVSAPDAKDAAFLRWPRAKHTEDLSELEAIARSALQYDLPGVMQAAVTRAVELAPISPRVKGLQALHYLISARDTDRSLERVSHLQKSLEAIAEATALAPDDLVLRRDRILIHSHIPKAFADVDGLEADLEFFRKAYRDHRLTQDELRQVGIAAEFYLRDEHPDWLAEFGCKEGKVP